MEREIKQGDVVEVVEDHEHSYSTDPKRYYQNGEKGTLTSLNQGFIQKGEVFTVASVTHDGKSIWYRSAGNCSNYIPSHKVIPSHNDKLATTQVEEVVGGEYRIVRNSEKRVTPERGKMRFEDGDTIVALRFVEEGEELKTFTETPQSPGRRIVHRDGWSSFPLADTVLVKRPDVEKVGMTPAHVYKPGDWVEVVDTSDGAFYPSFLWGYLLDYKCKVGTKVKLRSVDQNGVGRLRFLVGNKMTNSLSPGNVRPTTPPESRAPVSASASASTALPFLLSLGLLGVYRMNTFANLMNNDPVFRNCFHTLLTAFTGLTVTSFGWMSVKNVAKGVAQWQDRSRRLRQEDKQRESDMLATVIKAVTENLATKA